MIHCSGVHKRFVAQEQQLHWGIEEISIAKGERVLVTGPSGCGKTTLLNLLSGLLRPDEGSITIAGARIDQMGISDIDVFRGQHLGLIFQSFQLLSTLTVMDNLLLAAQYGRKWSATEAREHANRLLADVGLTQRATAFPRRLSIGEQQRVAIARALINEPPVLLADEPTASLDRRNATAVLDLLFQLSETHGVTLVMVSHDTNVASRFTRIIDASLWMQPSEQEEIAHV